EYLHNPPWAAEWIVHQAREHRIDGALVLRPRSLEPGATGRLFIERALEEAGIPVLPIEADVVDARGWDADGARASVRSFLDTRRLQCRQLLSRRRRRTGCCLLRRRSSPCLRCSCPTWGFRRSCPPFSRS